MSFFMRYERLIFACMNKLEEQMRDWILKAVLASLSLFLMSMGGRGSTLPAWPLRYNFASITMEDGLPHNYIDDIVKDSQGFLWVATNGNGVARYDSDEFITFNTQSAEHRLQSNFIRKMCEDPFGRLWVAGEAGIEIIDLKSLRTVRLFGDESGEWDRARKLPVHYMYASRHGNLWISAKKELLKVVFTQDGNVAKVISVCHLPTDQPVNAICEINGYLWLNYKTGIYRVDDNGADVASFSLVLNIAGGAGYVTKIFPKGDNVWIGTLNGLLRYDLHAGVLSRYPGRDYVSDISETNDHVLLVSTLKGLDLYNQSEDRFERIDNESESGVNVGRYGMLNCNFINCMLSDGDIVWIGTEAGGLNKMNKKRLMVRNYVHSKKNPESLSENPVNAIYEDEMGQVWVGNVEGGISCLNPKTGTFVHYTTHTPCCLSHNSVSCFTSDDQGKLWVGTWGGGIGWIDNRSANKRFHSINIPNGHICAICYDRLNDYVWFTTPDCVYIYDLATHTFEEALKGMGLGGIAAGNAGVCIDRNDNLWLGLTKGLCRINLRSVKAARTSERSANVRDIFSSDTILITSGIEVQCWENKLDDPASNVKEKISCIYQSSDGTVWVGSNGYGFYKVLMEKDGKYRFRAYTMQEGLINNTVRGILEDNQGNIWISTINGISCFHPLKNEFRNFTVKDGLISNQFYWNATCRTRNGELYFGSNDGLSMIKPDINYDEQREIPLRITDVLVSAQERIAKDRIEMHERDKMLQVRFVALDYDAISHSGYFYRLSGFDEQWMKASSSQHWVNYTNLHPGEYVFELVYSFNGKREMGSVLRVPITVTPYFYKTRWFIALFVITVTMTFYFLFIWRIHRLKRQRELLRTKVEERTLVLEKQKEELVQMAERIQELTVDKLAFFTNITHEFRTPLTLISGPIQRALKLSQDPRVIEQLDFAVRNSKYLLSLINQLMDFRKVESGKMKVVCNSNDLSQLLETLLPPFRSYAQDKGILIQVYSHFDEQQKLMFDEEAIRKMFVNLIANAIKFTPPGGIVSIYVASVVREGSTTTIYIGIRDTGVGIAQEDMEKIFDQFYQSGDYSSSSVTGQSGTGIGLYLCKYIVQQHGGKIWVKNNLNSGCTFRILLPLKEDISETVVAVKADFVQSATTELARQNPKNKLMFLVVEDNNDMRKYIRSILETKYEVLEAVDGKQALDLLHVKRVDFIISDLMMPVIDGIELSRRIKADLSISHIPFLMLTAKTSNETRIESFKIGVDEYLLKPFDDELLLARIDNILEIRRKMQQRFSYTMDVNELYVGEESGDKKFLDKAMKVVKENYRNSEYGIDDFVQAMGVSRSLLYRKIQSLTGQSAGYFIRNYRLNIARELILKNRETQHMNISEIAYEVGFNDPKYFTRCFTKHFNISPSKLMG